MTPKINELPIGATRDAALELMKQGQAHQVLAVIVKSVKANDSIVFKLSFNDVQGLLDIDSDLIEKTNLLNNSKKVWRELFAIGDRELEIFRILSESSSGSKKPAIAIITDEEIWNDLTNKDWRQIAECFKSLGYDVPEDLDVCNLLEPTFAQTMEQLEKYFEGNKHLSSLRDKYPSIKESKVLSINSTSDSTTESTSISNPEIKINILHANDGGK